MSILQQEACSLRGRVLKSYNKYRHLDVTGDGRCFYYAILKALGVSITDGVGAPNDTKDAGKYFNRIGIRKKYMAALAKGQPQNALYVIMDSKEMRRILIQDRGIRYIVRIPRTKQRYDEIEQYIDDPIKHVRQTPNAAIHYISEKTNAFKILHLSANNSNGTSPTNTQHGSENNNNEENNNPTVREFKQAFDSGKVITFVHRVIPGKPAHYELLLPRSLDTQRIKARARLLTEIANTKNWKKARKSIQNNGKSKRKKTKRSLVYDNVPPNHRLIANRMTNEARKYNIQIGLPNYKNNNNVV